MLLLVLAVTASLAGDIRNPVQRTIMKPKQLYLEDKPEDLCDNNPVMATECDTCNDMGLVVRDTCCSDLREFSTCHDQLIHLMPEWYTANKVNSQIPQMPETDEMVEPARKRYIARWGLTKGENRVQWGRPIKRFGMASGRRFNFNKFKEGNYAYKPSFWKEISWSCN